jgi:hypothetical protein
VVGAPVIGFLFPILEDPLYILFSILGWLVLPTVFVILLLVSLLPLYLSYQCHKVGLS